MADTLIIATCGGVAGAIGGAVSTCFFNTPALNKTAMKIVGLGALQGAVVQALGFGIAAYIIGDEKNADVKAAKIQLVSAAIFTVAAKVLLGTTYKEAFANYVISSALPWGILYLFQ